MRVNLEKIQAHYDGDTEMMKTLIEIFENSYKDNLDPLGVAIEKQDFDNIRLHAHTLKGMCANFFAEKAIELSLYLEKQGSEKLIPDDINQKYNDLVQELQEVILELKKI